MVRRKEQAPGLDVNQVVAWNFRAAREMRGWTQDECAARLAVHLGHQLHKASISAIERSVDTERKREFDANELVVFAKTFDLPVVWFLLPPPPAAGMSLAGGSDELARLIPLVLGRASQLEDLRERLEAVARSSEGSAERAAAEAFDFPVGVSWAHYQRAREDGLLALVEQESTEMDRLLGELRGVLERFGEFSLRSFMAAHPRQVYREVSHSLLGERVFSTVLGRSEPDRYPELLGVLSDESRALEDALDLEDPELRERLAALYDRVEEQLRGPKKRRTTGRAR